MADRDPLPAPGRETPTPNAYATRRAGRCNGMIEKKWRGHRAVLWRRECNAKTNHPSGYCHIHRVRHTSVRP